jgi:CRP-like cAMP-binding protein
VKASKAATLLAETELFSGFAPETLARLGERALERRYRKGQLIFSEGDSGDALLVLTEGLVKVFVTSDEGDEMVLITLRPLDTFGELALIDGGPRSASAQALEPTTALAVTRDDVRALMREHPQMADSLLASLGALVRRLTEQAADLVFLDLHGRVAKLLVQLAREGNVLDLNLTQSDLAAMVGGSRQSINQILQAFQRRGYLDLQGRRITLKRLDALSRRAGL